MKYFATPSVITMKSNSSVLIAGLFVILLLNLALTASEYVNCGNPHPDEFLDLCCSASGDNTRSLTVMVSDLTESFSPDLISIGAFSLSHLENFSFPGLTAFRCFSLEIFLR